jgi:phosphate transport system permease protein
LSNDSIRRFKDKLALGIGGACVVLAMIPLLSILFEVVRNGIGAVNLEFLTSPPGVIGQGGGGIGNSIEGSLVLIGVTCIIGIPLGLFSGIFLSEFGDNQFGRTIRFFNDVFAQLPSVVVGILAYTLVVLPLGHFSTIAGAAALAVIMLPIVTRTTEESLKLVPSSIRDASMALGIRKWRTIFSVVLSTGKGGVVTGMLLAIARIAGETAPLLLTVLGTQLFYTDLTSPIDALPLRIYRLALLPYPYARQQGWGAALILILIVLSLNVGVRLATKGRLQTVRSKA